MCSPRLLSPSAFMVVSFRVRSGGTGSVRGSGVERAVQGRVGSGRVR